MRWRRDGRRRRRRGAPTCPFGGGGCALRRADTAPRALTHWPALAGPASGRASLSLASPSPAGWRQRPECTPRGAPWDSSGLRALPAPGPAPRARSAPPPRPAHAACDGATPGAFPPPPPPLSPVVVEPPVSRVHDPDGAGSRGTLCCHRAPGRTSPPTATANKARSRASERASACRRLSSLLRPHPPPPLAGGPAPAQLHGLRLCAGKDTHADLEEALSSLRGLGSRTLTLRFLNPVVFVLGGSAALIHFPRVLTTCRTLLLPLLAACVKNASFFLLQRPHFLEWRGQALERLMVTVRGPESSDWKFGKTSRRK